MKLYIINDDSGRKTKEVVCFVITWSYKLFSKVPLLYSLRFPMSTGETNILFLYHY